MCYRVTSQVEEEHPQWQAYHHATRSQRPSKLQLSPLTHH